MTNETEAWNSFLSSGSVLDYLRYKTIQQAKKGENITEDKDEIFDQGNNNPTAEYR